MTNQLDAWPAGQTWVFQGTVAEDATAGTHLSSLTVTPGAGNEMEILYGMVLAGAGAANLTNVQIDDGANNLVLIIPANLSLGSSERINFPITGNGVTQQNLGGANTAIIVSGTMRLRMTVSTATTGLTHTFSVVCRIKLGQMPTATLADTIGTPVLTTNTNKVF